MAKADTIPGFIEVSKGRFKGGVYLPSGGYTVHINVENILAVDDWVSHGCTRIFFNVFKVGPSLDSHIPDGILVDESRDEIMHLIKKAK